MLVTGAGRGIGAAIALQAARAGWAGGVNYRGGENEARLLHSYRVNSRRMQRRTCTAG
jgi:NAD(P)-dependent dehydrogenase (short-subunit alcohol dehydrogenase family)